MKKTYTSKKPVIKDWHPADIKAALEKAGWSLRRLSQHHGYDSTAICKALKNPYPNAENIIASALGKKPSELWPSRYNADGTPKRHLKSINFPITRPDNWVKPGRTVKLKHNKLGETCNVYVEEVA